jgi:hypothetical protein
MIAWPCMSGSALVRYEVRLARCLSLISRPQLYIRFKAFPHLPRLLFSVKRVIVPRTRTIVMSTFDSFDSLKKTDDGQGYVLKKSVGGYCPYRINPNGFPPKACNKILAKGYSHCDDHRCQYSVRRCQALPIDGYKYCQNHFCDSRLSYPCPYEVENTPFRGLIRPSFCMTHRCSVWKSHGCNYPRDGGEYCAITHTCKEPGCLRFRKFDHYCTEHNCLYRYNNSDCSYHRINGTDRCRLHERPELVCTWCANGVIEGSGYCDRCRQPRRG